MIPTDADIREMKFHSATRRGCPCSRSQSRAIVCYSLVEVIVSCAALLSSGSRDIPKLSTDQDQIHHVSWVFSSI
jgi:hypothetical protein